MLELVVVGNARIRWSGYRRRLAGNGRAMLTATQRIELNRAETAALVALLQIETYLIGVETMADQTEAIRRELQATINAERAEREKLEREHGQVWTTSELQRDFTVLGFAAPLVVVRRKSDGVRGSLFFQHDPRYYYGFAPE